MKRTTLDSACADLARILLGLPVNDLEGWKKQLSCGLKVAKAQGEAIGRLSHRTRSESNANKSWPDPRFGQDLRQAA
jgi:hypothetical protein